MEWEYDSWNRIKQMTYPDGEVVTYDYDTGGQLFAMQGEKSDNIYPIIDTIFYDKFGSRRYIAYGNGTKTHYNYEPYRRRLAGLKTMSSQGMLMNLSYSYDNENNITGISNTAGIVNGLGGVYSYSFDYDDMYRLVSANGSFKNQYDYTLSMSYSPSGNITNKTLEALTLQAGIDIPVDYEANYNYNPGRPHAIESISGHNADHAFQWDENGNMTRHDDHIAGFNRTLCWDEENRLTAVRDDNNLSAYIYDVGGERVWKLTGQVQKMHIDGTGWVDIVDLNNKTLYVSPYLVFNETGYSKHYYAGAERVSSRIGGGMQDALIDPLNYTVEILSGQEYPAMTDDLLDMLGRNIECTGMQMQYVSMEHRLNSIEDSRNHNNTEDNRYIYHSDHLGSSSFLTDTSGTPTQHLQYLPFGEPFIEQRSVTDYYTPYTFSAKERDLETGYSYFGARYYDANISVWLSVDPMADKYPSMSPYMYCAGNPVILVDPDGRIIDLSELMKNDFAAFGQLMYDLYLLTGYSLVIDEDGRLVIDDEKGIARNANNSNKKIGSGHARREIRKAIDSQYIYCVKSSKNNDLSPYVDYDDKTICLSLSFVQKMTQNSFNLDPLNIGMGANFFHELSHLRRGTRDPKRNFNRKGSAVRYENKVLRQAGLATRRSYGIRSKDGINIPYDRKSKMALKKGNSPPADSKYAVFKIQVSSTRDI